MSSSSTFLSEHFVKRLTVILVDDFTAFDCVMPFISADAKALQALSVAMLSIVPLNYFPVMFFSCFLGRLGIVVTSSARTIAKFFVSCGRRSNTFSKKNRLPTRQTMFGSGHISISVMLMKFCSCHTSTISSASYRSQASAATSDCNKSIRTGLTMFRRSSSSLTHHVCT